MSLNYAPQDVTVETYARIFEDARQLSYPSVDAFEARMGAALDRERLEAVARVLSCPFKAMAPHWQHGRVIYSATWNYLDPGVKGPVRMLDIGTAKGFSAWSLLRALLDVWVDGEVTSVDVLSPAARVRRNTVAEVDGLKTLDEIINTVAPEACQVNFQHCTGLDWLKAHPERVHVAFVDGKHTGDVVRQEGKLLAARQQTDDLAIFDDCQMPAVSQAVVTLEEFYKFEYLTADPREYAIGRRR